MDDGFWISSELFPNSYPFLRNTSILSSLDFVFVSKSKIVIKCRSSLEVRRSARKSEFGLRAV